MSNLTQYMMFGGDKKAVQEELKKTTRKQIIKTLTFELVCKAIRLDVAEIVLSYLSEGQGTKYLQRVLNHAARYNRAGLASLALYYGANVSSRNYKAKRLAISRNSLGVLNVLDKADPNYPEPENIWKSTASLMNKRKHLGVYRNVGSGECRACKLTHESVYVVTPDIFEVLDCHIACQECINEALKQLEGRSG